MQAASLGLGDRLVTDLHVGAGGALPVAETLFATHSKAGLTDDAAVNLETNAGTHHHGPDGFVCDLCLFVIKQAAAKLNDYPLYVVVPWVCLLV